MYKLIKLLRIAFFQCIILNLFGCALSLYCGGPTLVTASSPKSSSQHFQSFESSTEKWSKLSMKSMDDSIKVKNIRSLANLKLPVNRKSFWNQISFNWANELLSFGNHKLMNRSLEISDLWMLEEKNLMNNVSERFKYHLDYEIKNMNSTSSISSDIPYKGNILMEFWSYPVTRAVVKM